MFLNRSTRVPRRKKKYEIHKLTITYYIYIITSTQTTYMDMVIIQNGPIRLFFFSKQTHADTTINVYERAKILCGPQSQFQSQSTIND